MGCLFSLAMLVLFGWLVNAGVNDGTATGGAMILIATFIVLPLAIGAPFMNVGNGK